GKLLAIVIFFHLVCIGWIFFRATPEQFWPIVTSIGALPGAIIDTLSLYEDYWRQVANGYLPFWIVFNGTVWGLILKNWTFAVYMWGLFIFMAPVWITDY